MADSRWLPDAPTRPDQPTLFCFPYAGGGASIFRSWPAACPSVAIRAVQLPGREQRLREPAFTEMPALIAALAAALAPWPRAPFAFFGHSMGALIAFELARWLQRRSAPSPVHLFVSARRAPDLPGDPPIHALPDSAFVEKIRSLGGTPEAALQHRELMTLLLPTLRADFALVEGYRYQPGAPLPMPITVFGGLGDSLTEDDLGGWCRQSRAACAVRWLPGDHFFMHAARDHMVPTMAAALGAAPF